MPSGTGRATGRDRLAGRFPAVPYVFDANVFALMAEWGHADQTYRNRIDHLRGAIPGGLSGSFFLNASTLLEAAASDRLFGNGGGDWFLVLAASPAPDLVKDKALTEIVTVLWSTGHDTMDRRAARIYHFLGVSETS